MGSLKALQDWCRTQCVGYKDVEITNMSSSFRDGLAFCAILHKHRPDLIDFDSLSKENVYENNRLAFEVAETELGIPALLDPEDMVSMKVPDRLSMITYVSQYYNFFTNKSHANPPCMKRPGGSGYGEPTVKKVASPLEEKTTLSESISESQIKHVMSSNCAACGKHVHLVQRFLVDGKLYHRNCFRCKECSSTLLPGSYKLIGDSGSLVCTHHFARTSSFNHNGRPDLNRQAGLSGSISSPEVPSSPGLEIVPEDNTTGKPMTPSANSHTTDYLQSRNKQNETTGLEKKEKTKSSSKDKKTEPRPPSPSNPFDESGDEDENRKQEGHPEVANNGVPLCSTEGMARPIPAPRKVSDPSIPARPVPKPRPPRQSQSPAVNGDEGIGNLVIPKPRERSQSPASETPKPKDPPWLALVKQESKKKLAPPPPPPPGIAKPLNNSSSVTQKEEGSRPESPPNPFDDDEDNLQEEVESKERPIPSAVVAVHPWYGISQTADVAGAQTASGKGSPARLESPTSCRSKKRQAPRVPRSSPSALSSSQSSSACPSPALSTESLSSSSSDHGSILRTTPSDPVSQQFSSMDREPSFTKSVSEPSINSPVVSPPSAELQSHPSPMPFIPSTPSYTCSAPSTPLTNRSAGSMRPPPPRPPTTPSPLIGSPSTQPPNTPSKRMNPFNRKASSTVTSPQSRRPKGPRPARPPAPGHGFPLIKRKVQSDQYIPVEDIHVEMGALERQLDDLEQTGVELEQKLRDCSNEEEEERLLVDWFTLIHEKHLLVRREAELVYTVKQQNLEERQADVEYELRCLLNKPEKDWSDDDRDREKQLMAELVTIIEQRNQIINSMDQERQKEEEEDKLVAAMLQKKDFHSESDQKKKPAKFKPIKVLKRLSIKGETTKSPSPRKEKS